MSKAITLSIIFLSSLFAIGQETPKPVKTKEYYLGIVNFAPLNFSLKYKRQLKNNMFFKVGLVELSASNTEISFGSSSSYPNEISAYSAGIEAGLEFRKLINEKFCFFHGPALSYKYRIEITKTNNPTLPSDKRNTEAQMFTPGIVYALGFLYRINDHFIVSAEINPYISYTLRTFNNDASPMSNSKSSNTTFGFSNRYGMLSLAYRI